MPGAPALLACFRGGTLKVSAGRVVCVPRSPHNMTQSTFQVFFSAVLRKETL